MPETNNNTSISRTIIINGINLHYRESGSGSGSSVVLLHGWGSSSENFRFLESFLASHFHIFNLDLPGFGGSAMLQSAWSLHDYVELVKGFLTKLTITDSAIIGHSFGGRIAICLGAQGMASKLILTGSAGIRPQRNLFYYIKVYSYKFAKFFLNLAPQNLRPILLEKLQQRFGSTDYRSAPPVLRQTLVKVVNEDLTTLLSEIKVPSLLLWGENDLDTPLYQAKVMEQKIPDAGLVLIKNAGHFCFLDKPTEFNLIAEHFLRN